MRKMKSITALLLICFTLLGTLAGCGETVTVLKETELPHYDYSDEDRKGYNTELFYANSYEISLGDPAILPVEEDGELWYYVTGTKSGKDFRMWKTKDFTNWQDIGTVYTPPENFFGVDSFWAPQLLFDPEADWQYYLGESAGEGKGLYILSFSARRAANDYQLAITFSKSIAGPYQHCVGTNASGDLVGPETPLFCLSKIEGLGLYEDHRYGALYKEGRSFIDACPYIDPVTGEKYLYMVRTRSVDKSNDVWGVKMKDWITPEYPTTVPLSAYGYVLVEKRERYYYSSNNRIDEGPFVYYKDVTDDGVDNGKYYLTLSIGDTNDKLYPVCQAIGDTPLGPFTKVQPEHGGLLNCPEMKVDIHGSGHHAFFEVDGELYIAYHTYLITAPGSIAKRYFAFDRVEWMYNDEGEYVMYSNGPTRSIQPLPSATSGYRNLAPLATISVRGAARAEDAPLLNDRLIAHADDDLVKEFSASGDVVITMDFENYVTARALMVYNSYDYAKAFESIARVELYYRKEIDGEIYEGVAYMEDIGFDFESNYIPEDYLIYSGETDTVQLRPCGAAIAEFDEIEINRITLYVNMQDGREQMNISEIVILGNEIP